jgi:hypothetical protein
MTGCVGESACIQLNISIILKSINTISASALEALCDGKRRDIRAHGGIGMDGERIPGLLDEITRLSHAAYRQAFMSYQWRGD